MTGASMVFATWIGFFCLFITEIIDARALLIITTLTAPCLTVLLFSFERLAFIDRGFLDIEGSPPVDISLLWPPGPESRHERTAGVPDQTPAKAIQRNGSLQRRQPSSNR